MSVLLTGGLGYIGSHTAVELLAAGREIVIADNLSNSELSVASYIERISGKSFGFYELDVCERAALARVFKENDIDAVIHFAGFKAVGESCEKPLAYYRNNIDSALSVLELMRENCCRNFVFSSSATVYGAGSLPLSEESAAGPCANPYGRTKYMIEQIVNDAAAADGDFSAVLLRYFNPVGAHGSGLIGEKPKGVPNNLMPYITQVAAGRLDHLRIFGDDYDTHDGTGVRDFIHVADLAKGHIAALDYAREHKGSEVFNLGTGRGVSVLELIRAFEEVNGIRIPFEIAPRRPGDAAASYASAVKARELLGWQAELDIKAMCRDAWNYEKRRI